MNLKPFGFSLIEVLISLLLLSLILLCLDAMQVDALKESEKANQLIRITNQLNNHSEQAIAWRK